MTCSASVRRGGVLGQLREEVGLERRSGGAALTRAAGAGRSGAGRAAAGPPGTRVRDGALLVCRRGTVGEPVGRLVERVTRVALDPLEADPFPRPAIARSRACMISTFMTGLPSPFFQPLRFQPGIHWVIELMTYLLSQ